MIKNLSNIVNAMLVSALCERLIKPTPACSTRLQPRTTLNDKLSTPRMLSPGAAFGLTTLYQNFPPSHNIPPYPIATS